MDTRSPLLAALNVTGVGEREHQMLIIYSGKGWEWERSTGLGLRSWWWRLGDLSRLFEVLRVRLWHWCGPKTLQEAQGKGWQGREAEEESLGAQMVAAKEVSMTLLELGTWVFRWQSLQTSEVRCDI